MYASCSSCSVGRLYASLLLISWCPNIWSIQFGFTPAFSRSVCSFFLKLCGDIFFSPILRNAFLIMVDAFVRFIRYGLFVFHVTNSGELFVTFSGFLFLEPVFLCCMYSLSALIDSIPKKVFAKYPVFSVVTVIGISVLFQLSKMMSQFRFMRSVIRSPVSFSVMTKALNVLLFWGRYVSKILIISGLVVRLVPFGVFFG